MFKELEIKKRKQLILIYEKYLKKQNIDELVEEFGWDSGYPVFSKEVNSAFVNLHDMTTKKISLKEAEIILQKLKSPFKKGLYAN